MRTTTWTLAAALSLSMAAMAAPALAQQPSWSQQGDYYAPQRTDVQQATPRQLNKFREGDYYAPGSTVVQHATPQERKEFREGDYYAPSSGK
jgi:hypothetical protein